jgi:hypothetical protein
MYVHLSPTVGLLFFLGSFHRNCICICVLHSTRITLPWSRNLFVARQKCNTFIKVGKCYKLQRSVFWWIMKSQNFDAELCFKCGFLDDPQRNIQWSFWKWVRLVPEVCDDFLALQLLLSPLQICSLWRQQRMTYMLFVRRVMTILSSRLR